MNLPHKKGLAHTISSGSNILALIIRLRDYRRPGTIDIDARLAMTSSREILHDIGSNKGPARSLIAFGYAGWGPGQLEGEVEHRSWFMAPEDPGLVFDLDRDKVWDEAMKRRTQDL